MSEIRQFPLQFSENRIEFYSYFVHFIKCFRVFSQQPRLPARFTLFYNVSFKFVYFLKNNTYLIVNNKKLSRTKLDLLMTKYSSICTMPDIGILRVLLYFLAFQTHNPIQITAVSGAYCLAASGDDHTITTRYDHQNLL